MRTGWMGRFALALSLGLVGTVRPAGADPEQELYAQALREKHPKIRVENFDAAAAAAGQLTDPELEDTLATTQAFLKKARAKWSSVQVRRRFAGAAGQAVVFTYAKDALAWGGVVKEHTDRIADIKSREDAEYVAKFGVYYHSIFIKKGRELDWEAEWYRSGRGGAYRAEEKAANEAYRAAIKERAKEQWHQTSPVTTLLDQMQEEAIVEITSLGAAERTLVHEQKKRRGEAVAADEAKKAEAEADEARDTLHLAPLRTEYEAVTGETVDAWFQVWKGAKPFALEARAKGAFEGIQTRTLDEAGNFTVPFTFRKAGTYTASVRLTDARTGDKSVSITITVTGDPIEDEKPPTKPKQKGEPTGGAPPVAAVAATTPFHGTFAARLWGAHAELGRWDKSGEKMQFERHAVPLTLTIEPSGALKSSVRYQLPAAEMSTPGDPLLQKMFWHVSFDLEGTVDWATGRTKISIRNGHDERGYEKDQPKTDDQGRKVGILGHWRDFDKVDYSMELEGWALPGPEAAQWIADLGKSPELVAQLKGIDLETLALPFVTVAADGTLAYRDRGFFGAMGLPSSPPPGGVVPHRRTFRRAIHHTGYDDMNEREEDQTASRQKRADEDASSRMSNWYLKVLGAAAAEEAPSTPDAPPKDDDVLAFGLWPTRPIALKAGESMSARAMGVFGADVYDAVDLSAKATWTASAGLTSLGAGAFKAEKPGTYTLTATFAAPSGPMSSTITVVVK